MVTTGGSVAKTVGCNVPNGDDGGRVGPLNTGLIGAFVGALTGAFDGLIVGLLDGL